MFTERADVNEACFLDAVSGAQGLPVQLLFRVYDIYVEIHLRTSYNVHLGQSLALSLASLTESVIEAR